MHKLEILQALFELRSFAASLGIDCEKFDVITCHVGFCINMTYFVKGKGMLEMVIKNYPTIEAVIADLKEFSEEPNSNLHEVVALISRK